MKALGLTVSEPGERRRRVGQDAGEQPGRREQPDTRSKPPPSQQMGQLSEAL